jgi:glutathione S-transferase
MFTIHGVFGSPFVRTIRIGLHEKHLPWAWSPVTVGQHKQEPYLSRHPFGKIPAVDDDGFALYETNAVLRYLERKQPDPALIPPGLHRAARMDQILCIVDNYLFNYAKPVVFNRIIAPRLGVPVNDEAVIAALPDTRTVLGALCRLHATGPYLTGDTLSLADIAVLPHIDYLQRTPEGGAILWDFPKLLDWLAMMAERPSVQASARKPEDVLQVVEKEDVLF